MTQSIKRLTTFYYLLVFLILTHESNVYLITHTDGTGYGLTILSALAIFLFVRNRKIKTFGQPIIFWALLMSYHLLNCYFRDILNPEYSIFTITVRNLALLTCVPFLYNQNRTKIIYIIFFAFLYNLIATYLTGTTDESEERLTGIYYTTQLGQMAGLACCLISLLIFLFKKIWLYSLYIIPIGIMLLSGSRNGLLVVCFALVMLLVAYISKGNVLKMLFFIVLAFVGYNYLQTTEIYDRLMNVSSEYSLIQQELYGIKY